jgi:hypothetical protein
MMMPPSYPMQIPLANGGYPMQPGYSQVPQYQAYPGFNPNGTPMTEDELLE